VTRFGDHVGKEDEDVPKGRDLDLGLLRGMMVMTTMIMIMIMMMVVVVVVVITQGSST
jgi:hypothetical protein